jgi:hypothetical protein
MPTGKNAPGGSAIELLWKLPQNWIPEGEAEWKSLDMMAYQILEAVRQFAKPGETAEFVDARGKWCDLQRRITKASGAENPSALSNAIHDVYSIIGVFEQQVVAPAFTTASPPPFVRNDGRMDEVLATDARSLVARAAITSGRTMTGILARSKLWHERRHEINTKITGKPDNQEELAWPSGLPNATENDLEIRVLTNAQELENEGRIGTNEDGSEGLAHCVGSYWTKCADGYSRILSVGRREKDGTLTRLSTAEVNVQKAENREFEILQHRARSNAKPDRACETAIRDYVASLENERLHVDIAGLAAVSNGKWRCGYDPTKPGAWENALAAWSDFLPRPMRKWTREDFAAIAETPEHEIHAAIRQKKVETEASAPKP